MNDIKRAACQPPSAVSAPRMLRTSRLRRPQPLAACFGSGVAAAPASDRRQVVGFFEQAESAAEGAFVEHLERHPVVGERLGEALIAAHETAEGDARRLIARHGFGQALGDIGVRDSEAEEGLDKRSYVASAVAHPGGCRRFAGHDTQALGQHRSISGEIGDCETARGRALAVAHGGLELQDRAGLGFRLLQALAILRDHLGHTAR